MIHKKARSCFLAATLLAGNLAFNQVHADVIIGSDLNSAASANAEIGNLYSGNRGNNGGGDQSMQFGDVINGTSDNDLLVGGLGIDILFGGAGDDILIGGTEDFNGFNRDRAFGEDGNDSFIWAPGDGNDFFDGGAGIDVLFMALVGESQNAEGETVGAPFFAVSPPGNPGSQDFDGIHQLSPGFPVIDIAGGPGFCEIVERDAQNQAGLDELNLDHLVRFILRGPRAAFEAADPSLDSSTLDNGLRVAVHLKNVEFLVCAGETANTTRIFDLREIPAQEVDKSQLPTLAAELFDSSENL